MAQDTRLAPRRVSSTSFLQGAPLRRSIILAHVLVIAAAVPLWWILTSITRLPLPTSHALSQLNWTQSFRIPVNPAHPGESSFGNDSEHSVSEVSSPSRPIRQSLGVQMLSSDTSNTIQAQPNTVIGSGLGQKSSQVDFVNTDSILGGADAAQDTALLSATLSGEDNTPRRVFQYSPRYRLSFTLLNENAANGGYRLWDVRRAIDLHLGPILKQLQALYEFDIESQIQYLAPLSFEPRVENTASGDIYYGLTHDELEIFVNSAEWSLSSAVTSDPVIHFLIFVPSASHKPLHIVDSQGQPSASNSFLIPQWGGVSILNPSSSTLEELLDTDALRPVFQSFASHLQRLLGVPQPPAQAPKPTVLAPPTAPLARWQVQALMHRRILENSHNAAEAVRGVVNLVTRIAHLPVTAEVQHHIVSALNSLDELHNMTSAPIFNLDRAFAVASKATIQADKAFFHPQMLAMFYYPVEHTVVIYGFAVGLMLLPIVKTLLEELRRHRGTRSTSTGAVPPTVIVG